MNFIRKNLLLSVVAAVVVLGAGYSLLHQNKASNPETSNTTQTQPSDEKQNQITVTIKDGTNVKTYTVSNAVGKTALEATQLATSDVKMTGTGANAYITTINGREAMSDKKEYWKLVINGQDSQVGAGSYTVKAGDTISWEIATY